jgi:hypothetical protein
MTSAVLRQVRSGKESLSNRPVADNLYGVKGHAPVEGLEGVWQDFGETTAEAFGAAFNATFGGDPPLDEVYSARSST